MIETIKKYKPKHYDHFIPMIEKIIGDSSDIHRYIKCLGTDGILVWLKSINYIEEKNMAFFEECGILITLVIRLFVLELDIIDVKLTNNEIVKLIERFGKSLKIELAFRKEMLDSTPKYSIIKD